MATTRSSLEETSFLLPLRFYGKIIKCAHIFISSMKKQSHSNMALAHNWLCSYLCCGKKSNIIFTISRHCSYTNRRFYRRKYTTNAILVLFYIVLHQQSHKVHAIINAQDEISSSNSISHTLKIYGGFTTIQRHNIFFKDSITPLLQMGKAHCKQMSISHSWFFTFSTTTK